MAFEASILLEALELLWDRAQEAVLQPVSASQWRALIVIGARDGVNLRDLGEALGSTPPSVSRLCDRLEAAGLVHRSRATASRREVEVRLSRSGRDVLTSVREARAKQLEAVLTQMLPAQQRALMEGMAAFRGAAVEGTPDAPETSQAGASDIA
ncbi:MarR family winged helix-turn-helix transcriptional regulator [Streptomyces sp. NPDC088762]|uniref:MarR family winged helix-turn-helix transcriptional regulator n=1 Tax=Streptomyces sp. NPDC088762 TaxID=3365891 RepID=UPI00382BBA2B